MTRNIEESQMPYREKTAWLSLIAMAVTLIPYFTLIALDPPKGTAHDFRWLALYAVAVIVQLAILGGGRLWLRLQSPDEAKAPLDERDNAIHRSSLSAAYNILIAGMIAVGCLMPFGSPAPMICVSAIFVIVVAEVVHHSLIVVGYRRQA
jgi:hypothetical protein